MKSRVTNAAVLVLSLAVACLAAPAPAGAMNFGFYGSGGLGATDWHEPGQGPGFFDESQDTRHSGAGVVLGTGFLYHPLSYRLAVGWEKVTLLGGLDNADGSLEGIVVDQDITLDLVGGPGPLRIWVGPELRLGFLHGSPEGGDLGDEDFLVLGLGPVIGADFMVSPAMGISWKLGYLVSQYAGSRHSDSRGSDSFVDGHAYASLAILFSTSGGYPEPQRQQYQPPLQPLPPHPQPPPPPPPGHAPPWSPQPW